MCNYLVTATELKDESEILPSGNSSYLWLEEMVGNLESPYNKVAMGVVARAPSDGSDEADDVQVEFVCVKTAQGSSIPDSSAGTESESESDSDSGSDSEDSAVTVTYPQFGGNFVALVLGILMI